MEIIARDSEMYEKLAKLNQWLLENKLAFECDVRTGRMFYEYTGEPENILSIANFVENCLRVKKIDLLWDDADKRFNISDLDPESEYHNGKIIIRSNNAEDEKNRVLNIYERFPISNQNLFKQCEFVFIPNSH